MTLKLKPIEWVTLALMVTLVAAAAVGSGAGLALAVFAIFGGFLLILGILAHFWRHESETLGIMSGRGDERQQLIDREASHIAGLTTLVLCIVATAVDMADGGGGWPFARIVGASGIVYLVVVLTARFRQ